MSPHADSIGVCMGRILHNIALFGCVGFSTVSSAFGASYSLLELPPQRSSKEAFKKYSRELDAERAKKLKDLGYNNEFRVISFDSICNGLGRTVSDADGMIKNYEKVAWDCIKSVPLSFCLCDTENVVHDFELPLMVVENKRKSFFRACLLTHGTRNQSNCWRFIIG